MGTRLYPVTSDDDVLEQLANVPAGTAARLAVLEAVRPANCHDTPEADAWYEKLFTDTEARTLSDFLGSGWGKLNRAQWEFIEKLELEQYNGTITDIELAYHMLSLKEVFLGRLPRSQFIKVGGVCWY